MNIITIIDMRTMYLDINESDCVDIDTGALIFSTDMMKSLYTLIETEADYDRHVNEKTRLSLYADFLYPLAEDSTLEAFYQEKPEGEFCPELTEARERVWNVLRPYRMKLLRLAPAKFIHFGTTREILELMSGGVDEYRELGWSRLIGSSIKGSETAGYNSVLSSRAVIGKDCYLEVSYVHGEAKVGEHCVLSYIDIHDEVIPDNVVMHGLKQRDGIHSRAFRSGIQRYEPAYQGVLQAPDGRAYYPRRKPGHGMDGLGMWLWIPTRRAISSRLRQSRRRRSMVSSLRSWRWTAVSAMSSRAVCTMVNPQT